MIEDGSLEFLQFPTRLNPELAVEDLASVVIDVERVRLAPRAIEREHQASRERLAQRHLRDDPAQLGHDGEMMAAGELGIDSPLERERTKLVEPRPLSSGDVARGEIPERRASPQTEGGRQGRGRGLGLAVFEGARRVGHEGLEPLDVDLAAFGSKPIAVGLCLDPARAQGPPEGRHVHFERVLRTARRIVPPDLVDQPIAVTVLPTFNTRSARTARGSGPPILIGPRGPTTSSGPRMRNSMAPNRRTVSKP